ncbi:hypothetical protein D3C71_2021820 [compost metagenome]
MRMSEPRSLSELSSAVISAMIRKMLNSSLAATMLALKMLPMPVMALPLQAKATTMVAISEGTTTFARKAMVRMMTSTPAR